MHRCGASPIRTGTRTEIVIPCAREPCQWRVAMLGRATLAAVAPGKVLFEIQPNLEWDKAGLGCCTCSTLSGSIGRTCCRCMSATTSRMRTRFERSPRKGIGVLMADPADPEVAGRRTAADYLLRDTEEVENFSNALAR